MLKTIFLWKRNYDRKFSRYSRRIFEYWKLSVLKPFVRFLKMFDNFNFKRRFYDRRVLSNLNRIVFIPVWKLTDFIKMIFMPATSTQLLVLEHPSWIILGILSSRRQTTWAIESWGRVPRVPSWYLLWMPKFVLPFTSQS